MRMGESMTEDRVMLQDIDRVLFTERQIAVMVERVGQEITRDYRDKNLLLVSVLKGSVVFMADLMRAITIPPASTLWPPPATALAPRPAAW